MNFTTQRFLAIVLVLAGLGVARFAISDGASTPFTGNRAPGILAAPSQQPTGEQKDIYLQIEKAHDAYLLSQVSEVE